MVETLMALATLVVAANEPAEFVSHRPMRPLPKANHEPLADGPTLFVHPELGSDMNDGSKAKPWRTISFAARKLQPGDTLCLRGGVYYEHVDWPSSGEEEKPIVVRSFPGELAILDGGLREFHDQPDKCWKPLADGAPDEYVSTNEYPQFNRRVIGHYFPAAGWEPFYGKEDHRPLVLGAFADSMVPLHGYRLLADLRDDNMLWDVSDKNDLTQGVYCGPGLWFNRHTNRIHIRLAHTKLAGLGERNYTGETDPRKLPLIISNAYGEDVLRMHSVKHVTFRDIVIRGGAGSPLVNLYGSENISLNGVTLFGGSPTLLVKATAKLKIENCAFRGLAAPWSSRASMKYRGTPAYSIICQRNQPLNHDFEFAFNEFTDNHDFAWIRYVKNLHFHHNFVDRFNDDGLEVGAKRGDHDLKIYQNHLSRCAITFTLHEMERDESPVETDENSGVFITRNFIDLRRGVFKAPPKEPDASGSYLNSRAVLCSDHGGPTWPIYRFYMNTVLRHDPAWRGYYGQGMGGRGVRNTKRTVVNNLFVQTEGLPGLNAQSDMGLFELDGNLHWSLQEGPTYKVDFFEQQLRRMPFAKRTREGGWMMHDLFADPQFEKLSPDVQDQIDLRLRPKSPAINAGVHIPLDWIDPLHTVDKDEPDLGAIPLGVKPWRVGIRGRRGLFDSPF